MKTTASLLGLFGLIGAVAAQTTRVIDFEQENRDASCDTECFWDNFHGSCEFDQACVCNQHQYRADYFCCMARNCRPNVVFEAITRHNEPNCKAFGVPYDENFDVEGVCGVKITRPVTSTSTSLSIPTTTTSTGDATVTPPASDASGLSQSSSGQVTSATDGAPEPSSSPGTETEAGASTSASPTPTSGAAGSFYSASLLRGGVLVIVAGWLFT